MRIYSDLKLPQLLNNSYVFLDTNVLIGAIKYPDLFGPFLKQIQDEGGIFITVYPVQVEFLRGTDTDDAYNERLDFIKSYCSIYPIDKDSKTIEQFIKKLGSYSNNMSYTDFLLCASLNRFSRGSFLLTSDLKDIPQKFFERVELFIVDTGNDIRNYGVYRVRK